MKLRAIGALIGLLAVAVGVGVLWHWGAGLAAGGLGLWVDMQYGR